MAIVRTVEWKLRCGAEEADDRIRKAFTQLELQPEGPPGAIHGASKRALLKNRWSAEVDVQIQPTADGSAAVCRVSMPAGTKHHEVAADIVETVGDQLFDDRGLIVAAERLGKAGRLFGRKELRHVANLLHHSEHVVELGQGQYEGKQGLVVLTDERLFFLEKSLGSETLEQFDLNVISSMSVGKKMTGEALQIFTAGHTAGIKSMGHGQADSLVRAFRILRENQQRSAVTPVTPVTPVAPAASSPSPADDPIAQIERLASLRDRGLLNNDEFEAKKVELIARM